MASCSICQNPKGSFSCGICQGALCKGCAHVMDAESFAFERQVPKELSHPVYCNPCFDQAVAGPLEIYRQRFSAAENVYVFMKNQSKETRLIKRKLPMLRVDDCDDQQETILRLAYAAVKAGCNAIVDVDLASKKEMDGRYQWTKWSGSALPVKVDTEKMERDRELIATNPN